MLDKNIYYWGTIRKAIVAFGTLFNDLHIQRRSVNNSVVQDIKVPLAYAPKGKFIAKLEAAPDLEEQRIQMVLPRMGFEITSIAYDPSRKINPLHKMKTTTTDSSKLKTQRPGVPYVINISLYVMSKNQDDGLQIVEQIIPYFNPEYVVTVKDVPTMNITRDIPIVLNNVSFEDQYEGNYDTRRVIMWTLDFSLKVHFYGPATDGGVIKRAMANTLVDSGTQPNIEYTVEVNPFSADANDNWSFLESFDENI